MKIIVGCSVTGGCFLWVPLHLLDLHFPLSCTFLASNPSTIFLLMYCENFVHPRATKESCGNSIKTRGYDNV